MKQKKITREDIPAMEEKDRMKYEIAEGSLGLLDQVLEEGSVSHRPQKKTGRIRWHYYQIARIILLKPFPV